MIVALIATHPTGHRLRLIGGLRYRLLNHSCRTSADIDYHWDGDLEQKQVEIADLLTKRLLPEVKKRFGYEGEASKTSGPDADSPSVKTVTVALYRIGEHPVRIEIPVDITSIPCADMPIVRTVAGTVYLTASDADMVESKVIALFRRTFVEQRDIVDIFLFKDQFVDDSTRRLCDKFAKLGIATESVAARLESLIRNRTAHTRAIDEIINEQIEEAAADNLKIAGGGGMIFDEVIVLLRNRLDLGRGESV